MCHVTLLVACSLCFPTGYVDVGGISDKDKYSGGRALLNHFSSRVLRSLAAGNNSVLVRLYYLQL
jgi:hypothetical protein